METPDESYTDEWLMSIGFAFDDEGRVLLIYDDSGIPLIVDGDTWTYGDSPTFLMPKKKSQFLLICELAGIAYCED